VACGVYSPNKAQPSRSVSSVATVTRRPIGSWRVIHVSRTSWPAASGAMSHESSGTGTRSGEPARRVRGIDSAGRCPTAVRGSIQCRRNQCPLRRRSTSPGNCSTKDARSPHTRSSKPDGRQVQKPNATFGKDSPNYALASPTPSAVTKSARYV